MTSKIAMTFDVLRDGKWHTIAEIRHVTGMDESQTREVTAFLKEYGFALVDEDRKRLKLSKTARKFLIQATTA